MRKLIDGKVYNTDTAQLVAQYFIGEGPSDYHAVDGRLFRTKKSKQFFTVTGSYGTYWGWNWMLLSNKEALDWCEEQNIEVGRVEAYFDLPEA